MAKDKIKRIYPAVILKLRQQALAKGEKFYMPLKPCQKGHVTRRYAAGGQCEECSMARGKRLYDENREARKSAAKIYRKENPNYLLNRTYGINKSDYLAMFAQQNGACSICHMKYDRLFIDHCHKTGDVRGLLCLACNTGLGKMRDSIEILQNSIKYLQSQPYKKAQ